MYLVLSSALDFYGRKTLTCTGLFVAGAGLICQGLPDHIGWLYLFNVITSVGTIPAAVSPYAVDYIKPESLGLLASYFTISDTVAGIITSSVVI